MRYPDQAAHFLGKLLRYVGEDNVLWGTDCLFYGSPQPMIQAMRAFQISAEFQERYGYPKLTKELKAKILGPERRRALRRGAEHRDVRVLAARPRADPPEAPRPEPSAGADDDGRDAGVPRRRPRAVGHDGHDARVARRILVRPADGVASSDGRY